MASAMPSANNSANNISVSGATASAPAGLPATRSWRVVDIIVASVLGVAVGLIFFVWNGPGYAGYKWIDALLPGAGGLFNGVWLLGGPLGALIIRKPGAAIFVETLAAIVSMALGAQWGMETVLYGFVQGLGAEAVVLLFAYRRFTTSVAVLSGIGAALFYFILQGSLYDFSKGFSYNLIAGTTSVISGALLAGLLAAVLTRALAATGALDRFAAGRSRSELV